MEVCEPKEILSFPATFRKTKGRAARMAQKKKTRLLWRTSDKNVKNLSKKWIILRDPPHVLVGIINS